MKLGIELFVWGSCVGVKARGFGVGVEGITTLVFLAHPVDDEHDEEERTEQSDNSSAYDG